MKIIKIKEWKSKVSLKDGIKEVDENTLMALTVLVNGKKPEDMPRGLDNFRLFNRLGKAFDEAEKTKVLKLEASDYIFLKNIVEKDIPSNWGRNPEIVEAIDEFLNAKDE